MSNTSTFLKIYNGLEKYLSKLVNEPNYNSIPSLINKVKDKNPAVEEYANDLWELAELRNALVHNKKHEVLAEVTKRAVELIKKISSKIEHPPLAIEVASKPVYVCQASDFLLNELKIMKDKVYTHVPVYDNGKFIGILSESSIFNWQCEVNEAHINLKNMKVGDIKDFLDIKNRNNEYFEFVSENTNAFLIKKWFTEAVKNRKRLGAVFVTTNGQQDGKLLGIITAWDLPRIK